MNGPGEVNPIFLGLFTTKSGIPPDAREQDRISQVIREASKGSKFYQHQLKQEERIAKKVAALKTRINAVTEQQLRKATAETEAWLAKAEKDRDLARTFAHIDMDGTESPQFASVPMAVGSESMLSTANYEARKYGVVSAMPGYIARKLCPHLVILPPNFSLYRDASEKVKHALAEYDPNSKNASSLDEVSLELTQYMAHNNITDVAELVQRIRDKVFRESGLTCTAGVAVNQQLAKMCSNVNKPNGQFILAPDRALILEFLHQQPVKRISGVGKVTTKTLRDSLGIDTCQDLLKNSVWIRLLFSPLQAEFLLLSALGLCSAFDGAGENELWERKSMSVERTFRSVGSMDAMLTILADLCNALANDLENDGLACKNIGIKMKSVAFDINTRAATIPIPIWTFEDLYRHASALLIKCKPQELRLLGVRASSLLDREEAEGMRMMSLDRFLGERTKTPPIICPACFAPILAHPDDHLRINEHLDKCLYRQTAGPKPGASKATLSTLDRFLKIKKD